MICNFFKKNNVIKIETVDGIDIVKSTGECIEIANDSEGKNLVDTIEVVLVALHPVFNVNTENYQKYLYLANGFKCYIDDVVAIDFFDLKEGRYVRHKAYVVKENFYIKPITSIRKIDVIKNILKKYEIRTSDDLKIKYEESFGDIVEVVDSFENKTQWRRGDRGGWADAYSRNVKVKIQIILPPDIKVRENEYIKFIDDNGKVAESKVIKTNYNTYSSNLNKREFYSLGENHERYVEVVDICFKDDIEKNKYYSCTNGRLYKEGDEISVETRNGLRKAIVTRENYKCHVLDCMGNVYLIART